MKETLELRINQDFAHLLFKPDEGRNLGTSVKVVELTSEDPRLRKIPIIAEEIKKRFGTGFFFGWEIKRKYSKKELDAAALLYLKIKTVFEPTGEECGTLYDETVSCKTCGANRKQQSPLILKRGTLPKKDISKTIGGEVVVSQKFVNAAKQRNMNGLEFNPVYYENKKSDNYYQIFASSEIQLSSRLVVGINPFDLSISDKEETYKCRKGDTLGLNLLSETYVLDNNVLKKYDFFASKQKIGVKRGLLQPEPVYFCSPVFRKMIEEEKLKGLEFEVANINKI